MDCVMYGLCGVWTVWCMGCVVYGMCGVWDVWYVCVMFVTTISVSPNFFKCNISKSNCPIALKFDMRVKYPKLYIEMCR